MDSFDKPQTSLDYQIEKFKKILDKNPEDLSVLMAYAEANLRKGNRLESMKAYQKVISLKPDVTDVRVALVKIYLSMNNFKDAYSEISRIFDKDAKHIEAHLLLLKLNRNSKIPGDLKDVLESHLSFTASPKKIRILQKLYEMEKRKYGRLIEDYDRQLQDDSGSPIIMYNRTKAVERVKSAEETLQDLESMVGEEEEDEIRYERLVVPQEEPVVPEEVSEAEPEHSDWNIEAETVQETAEAPADEVEEMSSLEEDQAIDNGAFDSQEIELPPSETPAMNTEEIVAATFGNELPDLPAEIEDAGTEPQALGEAEMPEEHLFESQDGTPILTRSEEIRIQELSEIEQIPIEGMEEVTHEVPPEGETIEIENVGFMEVPPPLPVDEGLIRKLAFYDSIKEDLEKFLNTISKTRGINASFIVDSAGTLVQSFSTDQLDFDKLNRELLQGIHPLFNWAQKDDQRKLFYWVLEFNCGLLVLYPLRHDVFLVVLGKQGANFGAIRFSIEKNTDDIINLFESVPV